MPIARIRTLDEEAISFLAPKLAAAGYQLQFVAPNQPDIGEADLEITVTRMDSATALEQARVQAEGMDIDVAVLPSAITRALPFEQERKAEEVGVEQASPAPVLPDTTLGPAAWTTPYHADIPGPPEELISANQPEQDAFESSAPAAANAREMVKAASSGLRRGVDAISNFADSRVSQFSEWKHRRQEASVRRRQAREAALREDMASRQQSVDSRGTQPASRADIPIPFPSAANSNLRVVSPALSTHRSGRDRKFRNSAIAAALVIAAAMIGWSLAGVGGPATPVGRTNPNLTQQTPFGAAAVSAPAQALPISTQSTRVPKPVQQVKSTKPSAPRRRVSSRHHQASASREEDSEVVIRHFGNRPIAQQAKAKTKDGVKVITEE